MPKTEKPKSFQRSGDSTAVVILLIGSVIVVGGSYLLATIQKQASDRADQQRQADFLLERKKLADQTAADQALALKSPSISKQKPIPMPTNIMPVPQTLAPHTVDSIEPLPNGKRIQINSTNPDLSREQCVALIEHYKPQAAPNGQISAHKPSRSLKGSLQPYCVYNFDSAGITFNDYFF